MLLWRIALVIFLVILSGFFSGLNIGLISLKPHQLKRQMKLGSYQAKKIYPLRKKGTLLLCTLLLGNVAVNASLSVFLGDLLSGLIAIVIATSLIVIFGEILPQAFFARFALRFGAKVTWLVWIVLFLLYPVAKPLSVVIDRLFGKEQPHIMSREELRLVIQQQKGPKKSGIEDTEYKIIEGSMFFSNKRVSDVMIPLSKVNMLNRRRLLNDENIREILNSGYSRIPVLNKRRNKVWGILFTKELARVNPDDKTTVQRIMSKNVNYIKRNENLDKAFLKFRAKKTHILVVVDYKKQIKGIITLEDILEEIVGRMSDEYDKRKIKWAKRSRAA